MSCLSVDKDDCPEEESGIFWAKFSAGVRATAAANIRQREDDTNRRRKARRRGKRKK